MEIFTEAHLKTINKTILTLKEIHLKMDTTEAILSTEAIPPTDNNRINTKTEVIQVKDNNTINKQATLIQDNRIINNIEAILKDEKLTKTTAAILTIKGAILKAETNMATTATQEIILPKDNNTTILTNSKNNNINLTEVIHKKDNNITLIKIEIIHTITSQARKTHTETTGNKVDHQADKPVIKTKANKETEAIQQTTEKELNQWKGENSIRK